MNPRDIGARRAALVAVLGAGALALAACGGTAHANTGSTNTPAASAGAGARIAGGNPPAATGLIAEIDGNTVQVQSQSNGQVAVDVTSKTSYTETKAAALSAVRLGSCVVATSAATSTGSAPTAAPTAITATTVSVSDPVQGSCSRGFAGRGGATSGARPSDAPTGAPSAFPTNRPTGTARAFGDVVSGQVTAINGSVLTVKAERRTPGSTTSTTSTVTVTVTSTTKYDATGAATKAALKVGRCMTAFGSTASDGTVTATRVAVSPATNGSCDTGFRRFGAGGGPTGGTGG